jgi:tetratricopeptide (TPR) repeat protein
MMKLTKPLMSLILTALIALPMSAQQQSEDAEASKVEAMIRQIWQEHDEYIKKGGKATDAANPARTSIETLWEYGQKTSSAKARSRALAESLHLLVHAGLTDEMHRRADAFKTDDAVWKSLINVLMEGAAEKNNYDFLLAKAKALAAASPDSEVKALAQLAVARAHWKRGDTDQAKAAFQQVITSHPNTPYAKDAEGNIHEIEFLNPGQTAPLFASKTITGEAVVLSAFKGRAVLLNFWASW